MGLRFRKSVKICDGLRLNFGKTGASVTVGSGAFKKTFNTNGNVTTTVGLPGTGIYWTETERRGSRNNRSSSTLQQIQEPLSSPQNDYQVFSAVDNYFARNDITEDTGVVTTMEATHVPDSNPVPNTSSYNHGVSHTSTEAQSSVKGILDDIKRIYLYEDAPIDWTELIAGATADDLLMDPIAHAYCAQIAPRILSGDVDAYLEVIKNMRPVDDLALYCGDFEFGTDNHSYIEVEFVVNTERVFKAGVTNDMLEEFISAITVRVARDLLALLPVAKVLVHVEANNTTILSVLFDKNKLCYTNYKSVTASNIINIFPHRVIENFNCFCAVERLTI